MRARVVGTAVADLGDLLSEFGLAARTQPASTQRVQASLPQIPAGVGSRCWARDLYLVAPAAIQFVLALALPLFLLLPSLLLHHTLEPDCLLPRPFPLVLVHCDLLILHPQALGLHVLPVASARLLLLARLSIEFLLPALSCVLLRLHLCLLLRPSVRLVVTLHAVDALLQVAVLLCTVLLLLVKDGLPLGV